MQRITIYDPTNDYRQGQLIEGENEIARCLRRGVSALPVDPQLLSVPAGGFAYRSWGKGIDLPLNIGSRICPMVLFVEPSHRYIYWAARVAPVVEGRPVKGTFRLVGNGSDGHTLSGGLSADVIASVPNAAPDPHCEGHASRGWTIYGRCGLSVAIEGWFGMSLYGTAENAKVLWSAVSQSNELADLVRR